MTSRDLTDLLPVALWGQPLFMRLAVPAFGPVALAVVRVAGAALCLLPLLQLRGADRLGLAGRLLRVSWSGPLCFRAAAGRRTRMPCNTGAIVTLPDGLEC